MQNFIMTADYHTHTQYSDGEGTIEENVKSAIDKGLKEIGITEHGFNHYCSGVKRTDIPLMRKEVNRLQELYPQIKIYLGIEANLLNLKGELDLTKDDIESLDYIIFGIHKLTFGKGVKHSLLFNIRNMFPSTKRYRKKVTDSYIKALENYPIKILVHPNYGTKCHISRIVDACIKHNVLLELNGKRISLDEKEAEIIKNSEVKCVLSSDAHSPQRVGTCDLQREFIQKYDFPIEKIVNAKIVD